jgi:hypothetical protein
LPVDSVMDIGPAPSQPHENYYYMISLAHYS